MLFNFTIAFTVLAYVAQLFLFNTTANRFTLLLKDKQFKFAFNNLVLKDKRGKGRDFISANRKTFPALVGTGSGITVGILKSCGFNTPHVYPRTEIVPENSVFNKPGDPISSCPVFVASFNSEDIGASQVPNKLFVISFNIVTAVFGEAIDSADIDNFKITILTSIATSVEECLTKCGIKKR
ncbi:hypothetical protein DL98DRAFT_552738 [Cadophora sp. DSE1049]|nr:hypothetical protein DL98DRAFT_552738 [Cadophora sp. DSE1049]